MTIDPELLKNLPAGSVIIIIPPSQEKDIKAEPEDLPQPVKEAKIPSKRFEKVELKETAVEQIEGEVQEGVRYFTKEGTRYFAVYDFLQESGYCNFHENGKPRPHNTWHRIIKEVPLLGESEERYMFVVNRSGEPISVRQTTPCLPVYLMQDLEQALKDVLGEPKEDSAPLTTKKSSAPEPVKPKPVQPVTVSNVVPINKNQQEVVSVNKATPCLVGNFSFNDVREVASKARAIMRQPIQDPKGFRFLPIDSEEFKFMKALIESSSEGQKLVARFGAVTAVQVRIHPTDGASNHFVIYFGPSNIAQRIKLDNYLPSTAPQGAPLSTKKAVDLEGIF